MISRANRPDPVDLYVAAVITVGAVCAIGLGVAGVGDLRLLLSPEVAIFAVFALVGEFVPLKVFTRGAEGEVTTSTCFALATMLAAGPLAAFICLASANLLADGFTPHMATRLWQLGSTNCALSVFEHAEPDLETGYALEPWRCITWMARPWDPP